MKADLWIFLDTSPLVWSYKFVAENVIRLNTIVEWVGITYSSTPQWVKIEGMIQSFMSALQEMILKIALLTSSLLLVECLSSLKNYMNMTWGKQQRKCTLSQMMVRTDKIAWQWIQDPIVVEAFVKARSQQKYLQNNELILSSILKI